MNLIHKSKPKFSIILPTYNECDNIGVLVHSIERHLKGISKEIIIVDDDSPDGTWKVAKRLAAKNKSIRVILRKKNHGLAMSIKEGIIKSHGNVLIIMDSDMSHPPRFLPMLVNDIKDNDIVIASRFVKGGRMIYGNNTKVSASKSINFFVRATLRLKIKDVTGGFFAIRKNILGKVDIGEIFRFYGDYFFHLMYHLKKENLKIKEIPFTYEPRTTGRSKTVLLKVGILYIREVFRILARHQATKQN